MEQRENLILRKINMPVRLTQVGEGMAFLLTDEVRHGWTVPRKHSPGLGCEPETSFLSL